MRASVYRMAAGGSPSMEPKLPCGSTSAVPHVPVLAHADQRGIYHGFAVRVVVAAGVAGDLGALTMLGARAKLQVVHGDEDAPLRGLEAVADIRQGTVHDRAHGVRQIRILHLLLDEEVFDFFVFK